MKGVRGKESTDKRKGGESRDNIGGKSMVEYGSKWECRDGFMNGTALKR